MTVNSAYADLFIRGESPGDMSRYRSGRLFYAVGPATEEQSQNFVEARKTSSRLFDDDRSRLSTTVRLTFRPSLLPLTLPKHHLSSPCEIYGSLVKHDAQEKGEEEVSLDNNEDDEKPSCVEQDKNTKIKTKKKE